MNTTPASTASDAPPELAAESGYTLEPSPGRYRIRVGHRARVWLRDDAPRPMPERFSIVRDGVRYTMRVDGPAESRQVISLQPNGLHAGAYSSDRCYVRAVFVPVKVLFAVEVSR